MFFSQFQPKFSKPNEAIVAIEIPPGMGHSLSSKVRVLLLALVTR